MTYNVFGGTLDLAHSINQFCAKSVRLADIVWNCTFFTCVASIMLGTFSLFLTDVHIVRSGQSSS